MEGSDWLLLFFLPLAAIASLALLILVVVPILFGAHLAIGYLNGEKRYIRHNTITGGLRGFAGLLGWWLGACLAVEGPASLLLTFISLHDASERKLLLPAVIGMVFAIAGFCLIRTSDKNDFKIGWPAVHTPRSALRRAVMRWLVWDWLPTTGLAAGVLAWLPSIVDMPEPLSSKPGHPTLARFAVAAAIEAVWATFNLLTPKSRRVLAEMVAELTGDTADVGAGAVGAGGGQDAPPNTSSAIKLPYRQPEHAKRAGRLSSKPTRVLH
jgi:hypothetical protein